LGVFWELGKALAEVPHTMLGAGAGKESACTVSEELSERERQGGGGLPGELRAAAASANEICGLWKVWVG